MTLPLPRPGPSNYQDEPGFELDLLWDQAADAIEATYAAVTAHLANTSNPHSVTKAQVGLGSVDNTADTNKPVSTAQAAADTAIGSAAASDATTKANSAQAAAIAACPAETATTIGALINGATTDSAPVDADQIGIMDSTASNILKKLSWANLKTALQSAFATLAGTSGGQTLIGGTAASETLTLRSTSNATKGKILFGTSTYDEASNRIGVGTTTPNATMHLLSTSEQLRVAYNASNYGWLSCSATGGLSWSTTGSAGVGVNAQIYCTLTDATTNGASTILTLSKAVAGAGVGDVGLGSRIIFRAETSTTTDTLQAFVYSSWTDATHATYKSRLTLGAYDSGSSREGLRLEADGSVARIGFYGATAVVKPTALTATVAAAPAGGTGTAAGAWDTSGNRDLAIATINNLKTRVDQLETKLQAIGLLT